MILKFNRSGILRLAIILTAAAMMQPPAFGQQQQKKEDFHVDVTVSGITIAVTVQDKGGRYINNLEAKDFIVYENNDRRTITYFKHDSQAPASLAVLLDVSGSMAVLSKLEEAKIGLRNLVNNVLKPKDEIALLIFADGQVEVAAPFSTDRTRFLEELNKVEAFGKTALNDAVAVSPEFANRGRNEKRALLLVTDGVENDSQLAPDKALEIAKRVDVPIFTIGYGIGALDFFVKGHLRELAAATGAEVFSAPKKKGSLDEVYQRIDKELRAQYLLTYRSPSTKGPEAFRMIRVEVKGEGLASRTIAGYYPSQ
jgi:Ca-activated chloride channel family protein